MSAQPIPPPAPDPKLRARQKTRLTAISIVLAASGLVVLVLPVALAPPVRLSVAFTDLLLASAVWFLVRQKFPGK